MSSKVQVMGEVYLEGCQDLGEDVRLDDHLRQVHAVLGDLGEARADLEGKRKSVVCCRSCAGPE